MKYSKSKLASKALAASSIALISCGVTLPATSCSKNIEDLFFTVKEGDLQITFCDRGASIYQMKYKDDFITYHPGNKQTFLKEDYYYGKVLGRIAGRFKDGIMHFNEKDYQLEVNEKAETKNNSLHGGSNSFTNRDFKHTVYKEDDKQCIKFNYVSPANEAGYPESVDTTVIYTLGKNSLDIDIKAIPSGPTPLNITTHPYFNLGESRNILNHELWINSNTLAAYEWEAQNQTVVGVQPIQGDEWAPWDFSIAKPIGQNINEAKEKDPISGGYDHIWCLNRNQTSNNPDVILSNLEKNLQLTVTADNQTNGVIMYANCYPHDGMTINDYQTDTLYAGITIEPYKFFANNDASNLMYTPGNPFTRHINYTISNIF